MTEKKWVRVPNPRYFQENWSEEMLEAARKAVPAWAKKHKNFGDYRNHQPWEDFKNKWMPLRHTEQHFVCFETGERVVHMVQEGQDDEINRLKQELADLKEKHEKLRQAIGSLNEWANQPTV